MFFFGAHSWRGLSGRRYRFYVGKATDLRNRLLGHEKWGRAYWYYGATERYVLGPIRDEVDRRRIEEDLIKGLKPRMNDVAIPQARASKPRRTAQAARLFDMSAMFGRRPQRA